MLAGVNAAGTTVDVVEGPQAEAEAETTTARLNVSLAEFAKNTRRLRSSFFHPDDVLLVFRTIHQRETHKEKCEEKCG